MSDKAPPATPKPRKGLTYDVDTSGIVLNVRESK